MPKRVFIWSAAEDAVHVQTLKKHLMLYERQNLIRVWEESMILPGDEWRPILMEELRSADLILLLFSPDLLVDDFLWSAEMDDVLHKAKQKKVQLIPILLRPSAFKDSPFEALKVALPSMEKPISTYPKQDDAWVLVTEQIVKIIKSSTASSDSSTTTNSTKNMIPQSLINEVNNSISRSRTPEAIDAIIRWAHDNGQNQLKNDAAILKGALEKLKREEMLGLLSFAESSREYAKINNGVLNLLSTPLQQSVEPEPKPSKPEPIHDKLSILMMTANPAGTTKVNLDKEHSRIAEKIQVKTEQFSLKVFRAVSSVEFRELNEVHRPNLLHFSGHGAKGEEKGGIMVQNDDKNGYIILTAKALDAMFEYFQDEAINFKAVILNACYSEMQAKAIARYVPYVIATTTEISDSAAIDFSVGFYFKLDDQANNIEQAFRAGRAQAVAAGADKEHFILYKAGQVFG